MWRGSLGNRSAHQQITRLSPRCRSMQLREFAQSRKIDAPCLARRSCRPSNQPKIPRLQGPENALKSGPTEPLHAPEKAGEKRA